MLYRIALVKKLESKITYRPRALVLVLVGDGRWPMDDGRWPMADGRWATDDGRWAMDDGRQVMGEVVMAWWWVVVVVKRPCRRAAVRLGAGVSVVGGR